MAKTIKREVKEKIKEKTCWYCKQGIQYTDSEITITTAPINPSVLLFIVHTSR